MSFLITRNFLKANTILFLVIFGVCLILPTSILSADISQKDNEAIELKSRELSMLIFSPFCPGRTLADCPSSAATELRHKISDMLRSGKNDDQVMQELYALYGEQIRATPKMEGFGWFGWFAPAVFFILGLFVVAIWLRFSSKNNQVVHEKHSLDRNIEDKIEAEVRYGQDRS